MGGKHFVVIGFLRFALSLRFYGGQLFKSRMAFLAFVCQHILDALHLFMIREFLTESNGLDRFQRFQSTRVHTVDKVMDGTALLKACSIILFFVDTLAFVQRVTDDLQQNINQRVL